MWAFQHFGQPLNCAHQIETSVTQLITSTHDWASTLKHRDQSDVILLDFSKAFDTVSHPASSAQLLWHQRPHPEFLSGRTQSVSVNGTHSSWENVTAGVPQGSVLGPALFLLYINDIQEKIQSKMKLFADDSIVYREILSVDDHYILQRDLDLLADWSSKWLMHFNIKICQCRSFNHTKKKSQPPSLCYLWWEPWASRWTWLPWSNNITWSPLGKPLSEDHTEGQSNTWTALSYTVSL